MGDAKIKRDAKENILNANKKSNEIFSQQNAILKKKQQQNQNIKGELDRILQRNDTLNSEISLNQKQAQKEFDNNLMSTQNYFKDSNIDPALQHKNFVASVNENTAKQQLARQDMNNNAIRNRSNFELDMVGNRENLSNSRLGAEGGIYSNLGANASELGNRNMQSLNNERDEARKTVESIFGSAREMAKTATGGYADLIKAKGGS